jgi:hypothetical protein
MLIKIEFISKDLAIGRKFGSNIQISSIEPTWHQTVLFRGNPKVNFSLNVSSVCRDRWSEVQANFRESPPRI